MKVCIVSEGSYPVLRGGLSEWAHLLIKTLNNVKFDIYCIAPEGKTEPVYERLPNIDQIIIRPLNSNNQADSGPVKEHTANILINALQNFLTGNSLDLDIIKTIRDKRIGTELLRSRSFWEFMAEYYEKTWPEGPFIEYFWTVYSLFSILMQAINSKNDLPRADIYHSISTGFAGLTGALAKTTYGCPLVITEQGLYMVERRDELSRERVSPWYRKQLLGFSESIVKTSYRYADRIVPPCYSHKNIEKELGADLNKVEVINNGIDCQRFIPGPVKNGHTPVIGCFARVVPIKGITTFMKAAKTVLEKHPAEFVVVGEVQDQEYYRQCQRLANELGINEHFRFIGHANSLEWYHRVDIFTLTSVSEGVPYALLEAMSCGLPSVCTAVGGVPEIIEKGTGYVVPPNEPDRLAEKYGELLSDKELRFKLGQRAIEVANTKYTLQEMAGRFYDLYQGLLNGRGRN